MPKVWQGRKGRGVCAGQEERQVGALSGTVMWKYIAGTGGMLWLTVLMFLYAGEQASKIITDRWPGLWTQDQFDRGLNDLAFYLSIYAALALLFGTVTLLRSLHFTFGAVRPRTPPLRCCAAACFGSSCLLTWPACGTYLQAYAVCLRVSFGVSSLPLTLGAAAAGACGGEPAQQPAEPCAAAATELL